MTNADPLPPIVLSRKAVVYVRQSTPSQVQVHLEGQRRQYDLLDMAGRPGAEGPARKLHRQGDLLCAKPMGLFDTLHQQRSRSDR